MLRHFSGVVRNRFVGGPCLPLIFEDKSLRKIIIINSTCGQNGNAQNILMISSVQK